MSDSPFPNRSTHTRTLLNQQDFSALLDHLLSTLDVSTVSKKNIMSGWRLYIQWLEQEGGSLSHPDIAQAEAYVTWLRTTYNAPATLNNRLSQVRKLYRLLQADELVQENPFEELHGLVNPAHERRPFYSQEEIERLLAHAELEQKLLILLGSHAGLTGPEILQLTYKDCLEDTLHIGSRLIEMTPELRKTMQKWKEEKGERPLLRLKLQGLLFQLTDHQALRAVIWQLCQKANVEYRGWYALRNAAGLRMVTEQGTKAAEQQLGIGGRAALHPTVRIIRGEGETKKDKR